MSVGTNGSVQVNKKAIIAAIIGGTIGLYFVYSWFFAETKNTEMNMKMLQTFDSWKTREFVDIPQKVKDKMKTIKISEHNVDLQFDGQHYTVHFKEFLLRSGSHPIPVLLLHGAGSSSDVWVQTHTLPLLAAMSHRVVALDLPGWGKSHGNKLSDENKAKFLARFIDQENLDRPLLVSPSMSGSFSIPFVMGEPFVPFTCQKRVRGFIPVAPGFTEKFTDSQYHKCEVPTMIVYGEKDKKLGLTSLNNLRNLNNKEIFEIDDAGHPCYIEKPEEWRKLLYNFILALERSPQ